MMDTPKKPESRIGRLYDGLRSLATPSQLTRKKTGAGIAVVADLLSLIHLSEDGEKFEKIRLCILQDNEYAKSIYPALTSRDTSHKHHSSRLSDVTSITPKITEDCCRISRQNGRGRAASHH